MLKRFSVFLILFVFLSSLSTDELKKVRSLFEQASESSEKTEKLKQLTIKQNSALCKGYHGISYALSAKHAFNPYTKLNYVKKSLSLLNDAVLADNKEVEIRFLRFSVEENVPSVVSFVSHINEDKKFIIENLNNKHSYYLVINAYMKKSKSLSTDEKTKLK